MDLKTLSLFPHKPLQVDENDPLVIVGQLGAPYGIKGWNHLRSFMVPQNKLLQFKHWFVQHKNQWFKMEVLSGRIHGQSLVAQLSGFEDRDKAALLTQCHLALLRSQLPTLKPQEYYWVDLEGLTVKTATGEEIGIIQSLYDNAGLDIMIVKKDLKEQHIPFLINDTVLKVDLDVKEVIIDWDIPL